MASGEDANGFIQFRLRSGMFPRASPRDRDRSLRGEKTKEFARATRAGQVGPFAPR